MKLLLRGLWRIAIEGADLLADVAAKEASASFLFACLYFLNDLGRNVALVLNGQKAEALAGIQDARFR